MTRFQRIVSSASILGSVLLGYGATAMAAPDGAVAAQNAAGHEHGHKHRHGRGDLVRASLRLESLSATQRQQIEALVTQEKAARAPIHAARAQLMEAVARGLAAGNVDSNAVKPRVQALESAIASAEPGERATLEKLHGILTPAQRTEVTAHAFGAGGRGPKGADAGAQRPEMKAHGDHGGGLGPLGRLNLSDTQKQQIEANLKSGGAAPDKSLWQGEMETHRRVMEAFKNDRFVMNELAPPKDPRVIDAEVGRMVSLAKAAAPVLTAEQRTEAAQKLRAHAEHAGK